MNLDRAMDALIVSGFSRIGYKVRSRGWRPIGDDMTGRTAVITGATSGLGKATAAGLARLAARLILVGRDPEKTAAVLRELVLCRINSVHVSSRAGEPCAVFMGRCTSSPWCWAEPELLDVSPRG